MTHIKTLLAWAMLATGAAATAEAPAQDAANRLARQISNYAAPIDERANPRVLAAMRAVARHLFVPSSQRANAYDDDPLPIGEGQTISQPSLVALMTHLLRPERGDVMLEVGTGSGYQAAILSRLVQRVYTIEIVELLARRASDRLSRLGYDNVSVRYGDGYAGWPQHAPFDGIIVTAGAPRVPQPLVDQLKLGGRMVIPVGSAQSVQHLMLITKGRSGAVRRETIIPVRFVPLTRKREN